jgi:hypothetical protein
MRVRFQYGSNSRTQDERLLVEHSSTPLRCSKTGLTAILIPCPHSSSISLAALRQTVTKCETPSHFADCKHLTGILSCFRGTLPTTLESNPEARTLFQCASPIHPFHQKEFEYDGFQLKPRSRWMVFNDFDSKLLEAYFTRMGDCALNRDDFY